MNDVGNDIGSHYKSGIKGSVEQEMKFHFGVRPRHAPNYFKGEPTYAVQPVPEQ